MTESNPMNWKAPEPFLFVATVILTFSFKDIFSGFFLPLLDWTCEVRQERGRACRGDSKGPRLQLNQGRCGWLHGSHSLPGELPVTSHAMMLQIIPRSLLPLVAYFLQIRMNHFIATAWFTVICTKAEKSEFRLYSKQYHFFLPQSEHGMLKKEKVRNN